MTPPKDQAPGLIERLRDTSVWHQEKVTHTLRRYRVDRIEASTRIKKLEAENAELRGKVEKVNDAVKKISLAVAMQEKDQLYPDTREGWMMACDDIEAIALDALAEQANIRSPVQSQMAKMVDPR